LMVGEVYRPWTATFKYFDTEGHEHTLAADDKQTRILLHEIDHLDGIICSDKYEPKTFRYVTGGREELMALPSKRLSA
jgi:peptide deformylase